MSPDPLLTKSKHIESSNKNHYKYKAFSNRPTRSRRRSSHSRLTEKEEKLICRLKRLSITIIGPNGPIGPEDRS